MNERSIFLSIGHSLSVTQLSCLQHIQQVLSTHFVKIVAIERKAQMVDDPIGVIRNAINETNGTLVLAFIRYAIPETFEFPWLGKTESFAYRLLSTVWNQIEGAMALQVSHPLLIICEKGLSYEGIIDPSIYPVIEIDLNASSLDPYKEITMKLIEWLEQLQ